MSGKGQGDKVFPDSVQPGIPVEYSTPEGWQRMPFGEALVVVERPIKLASEDRYDLVTAKRSRGGIVKRQSALGKEVKTPTQFRIKRRDFLISRRQIVHGACGIVPENLDNAIVSNEYAVLNPKQVLDLDYFNHFTHTIYFQQTCFHSSIGVHVEKMVFKIDDWLRYNFNLPPIWEQRKIAEILSHWDHSLSILSQLLGAKRQQKRGLAEQLLMGKLRLPGFDGEWEESTMGTVFGRVRRKNTEGNDHALTISGVHGLIDQREFFNKRVAAKDLSGYYLLRRGEFAYNKSYSTGYDYGAIKRLNRYEAGVVSTLYICFALKREDAVSDFYEHFFEANLLNEGLAGIAQEGARNHGLLNVSVVDFFELPVPFPPPEEQQAIAAVLSTMDSEIASLEALKAKVAEQKRGLMDALLTGRVRVNVEDAS